VHSRSGPKQRDNRTFLISLLLVAATVAVFWQVGSHDFTGLDDGIYVTQNRHVVEGLTREGIAWAFSRRTVGLWHPLTWLSLMLDSQIYGRNPTGFHFTNLGFHLANVLLLFFVLFRMTGAELKSAFVAALFALHPLHVESVAWITERKDVLSTFFWFLTIWAYLKYFERGALKWYGIALLFFAMGLLSKPMLVTLPFVLLLLDYWPLCRIGKNLTCSKSQLFLEKIPFFVLAVIVSIIAIFEQQEIVGLIPLQAMSFWGRAANGLVSYVKYIEMMFCPRNMSIFYPFEHVPPLWETLGSAVFIAVISILVLRYIRKMPWLGVGWLWYLGTLIPVLGLVQVGSHAMADRYTYVPFIGLFIAIVWSVPGFLPNRWLNRYQYNCLLSCVGIGLLVTLATVSWFQTRYWKDDITLFEHALAVNPNNVLAHNVLGNTLVSYGKINEAIDHYLEALRILPNQADTHLNLGLAFGKQGKLQEAIVEFNQALRANPNFAEAHSSLGVALAMEGKYQDAIAHYLQALRISPDSPDLFLDIGAALASQGKTQEAAQSFTRAIQIDPNYAEAQYNLGLLLEGQGNDQKAVAYYSEALRIKPGYSEAHNGLGNILVKQGKIQEAIGHYAEALRIKSDFAEAMYNLGLAYFLIGNKGSAIEECENLKKINPELAKILYRKIS
jgi:tetratricopeptide (TPR) repeat protein